jgi:hypothetical protein
LSSKVFRFLLARHHLERLFRYERLGPRLPPECDTENPDVKLRGEAEGESGHKIVFDALRPWWAAASLWLQQFLFLCLLSWSLFSCHVATL